jgi:tetratricopeptide (TPR) repeat protein
MKLMYRIVVFICLLALPAWAAQIITVRSGIHDRYNRLVFDWTSNVTYTMQQQEGGIVAIQFDQPASANFKPALAGSPPFIRNLSQQGTDKGLYVTFQIPKGARVQAFPVGTKIAFDVLLLDKGPPAFNDAVAAPIPSAPVKEEIAEKAPPKEELPKAEEVPPSKEEPKIVTTSGPTVPEKLPEAKEISLPPAPNETAADPKKLRTLADALADKPPEKELDGTENKSLGAIKGTVLRIQPQQMTKLAAFERGGKLWLVIDQPIKNLLPRVEGAQSSSMQNLRRIDGEKATAFVFDAPPSGSVYSIHRDGNEWQVWLNPADKPYLPNQMPITVADEAVSLYAGENPQIIALKDSQLGDTLWIVPVRAPEARMIQPRKTSSYELIPTLMGATIIPRSDILRITTANDLVLLSAMAGQGMLVSPKKDRQTGSIDPRLPVLYKLDVDVSRKAKGLFEAQRQELEKQLNKAKTLQEKADRNIELTRLYLSYGFGPEASGLLRIAQSQLPNLSKTATFQALQGMAAALMGATDQAVASLNMPEVQSHPMSKLWLGYAYAQDNQWINARAAYIESGTVEENLPERLRPRVLISKAETALQAGDIISAQQMLKSLSGFEKLPANEAAARDYIHARIFVGADKGDKSIPLYEKLVSSPDQLYRAKAELDLVEQQLKQKEIDLPKAIERLERLRFSWRGDRVEIEILRRLGQYYMDNNKYMDGLAMWRQAASLSRNQEDTDAITVAMQDKFKQLYVDGLSDPLQPLQAVAIFERFRELTPTGPDGDVAIQRLADRLISVDLLDQADDLLQNQLLKHAQGLDAVKIGTKLAGIRIKNDNPTGAIKALDESNRTDVSNEELDKRRLLLRARAMADLKDVDEALALLATQNSEEALSLKADINWRQNRWPAAVVALQSLVNYHRDKGETAVDGPIAPLVLKMAIALLLDDNQKGIQLLIAEYGGFMAQTKQAAQFNLITKSSRGSSLADIETLKNQVGEVELFENFLKNF